MPQTKERQLFGTLVLYYLACECIRPVGHQMMQRMQRAFKECNVRLHSFLLEMIAFRALADQLSPCKSVILCLTTAVRNFNQSVLAKIYRDYAIMEVRLSFHDVTKVQNMYQY